MNRIFTNNVIHEEKNKFYESVDKIWEYAETSLNEYKSMETLIEMLGNEGFQIQRNLGGIGTAFKAEYGIGGINIGLLAEYDALPGMSQESNFSKKKKRLDNDNGHACGHNLIGVGVSAAAIAIKRFLNENKLAGRVTVFGCPAEETSSGKTIMAKEGCFNDVDLAITWHPFSHGVGVAGKTLATAQIKFKFSGKSSHAALAPHLGRSALDSVELMNIGANYLREHVPEGVKFHYAITNSGGIAPNIIPEFAEVLYLVRANDSKTLYEVV
ncbi:MAG: amidohydrolase, partial [Cetobacterium sp.]